MGILTSYFLCNRAIRSLSVYNAIYNSICHAVSDTDPNNNREKQLEMKWWYQSYMCLKSEMYTNRVWQGDYACLNDCNEKLLSSRALKNVLFFF